MSRRPVAAGAAVVVVLLCSCGGSSPENVVKNFADAYAAGNIDDACALYDMKGDGRMSEALLQAAGNNRAAQDELTKTLGAVKGRGEVCAANLGLVRKWDPKPKRLASLKIQDVDAGKEGATVASSAGEWKLNEVDGDWKLSNADPAIPSDLRPKP